MKGGIRALEAWSHPFCSVLTECRTTEVCSGKKVKVKKTNYGRDVTKIKVMNRQNNN